MNRGIEQDQGASSATLPTALSSGCAGSGPVPGLAADALQSTGAGLALELRAYSQSLRTWTLASEEIGNVRPLRDLLREAADALCPRVVPLSDDEKAQIKTLGAASYDAWARRVGEMWPWLHPDYDPDSLLWQVRVDRARRRDRATKTRGIASVDRSGEAGETRSEAKGLDPKDESAVPEGQTPDLPPSGASQ